ncbi:MAG: hypothetical protein ACK45H_09145 [Bacteroidota bacterium]|jgi:hypothetical protein
MEANVHNAGIFSNWIGDAEFNRFGLICVILTVVGCLGGTAVGMGAISSTLSLILVTIPTMLTLSLLLAVAPMRWIFTAAAAAIIIDLLMILYYTLLA